MSTVTRLYTPITFFGKTYNTLSEVNKDYDRATEAINDAKNELLILIFMTEPQKFVTGDESPSEYLNRRTSELFDIIAEYSVIQYKLSLLIDKWDAAHDSKGLAIDPPDDIRESAFMSGDFVLTEKYPTINSLL